jgi:predicted NBD/HSP70 family sugar kinase
MIEIGVDFGGTKIEVAAIDADGHFLARLRAPNPGGYDAAIETVCKLVAEVEAEAGEGGLSNVSELYTRLPDAIRPYIFSQEWSATIVPARWGDSSGVRGAARLWRSP